LTGEFYDCTASTAGLPAAAACRASAASARKWVIWSVIIWVVGVIIYGILVAVGAFNVQNSSAAMLAAMF
jgi:hypothetical protein